MIILSNHLIPNELVARVKAHISRYERLINRETKQLDIQVNGLTIQSDSRQVFFHDEEKILTAKEFDLLKFLATHPNIVFTKEQLMERIWGYDAIGDLTTVIPFISERFGRKSRPILPIHNLSKQFGG